MINVKYNMLYLTHKLIEYDIRFEIIININKIMVHPVGRSGSVQWSSAGDGASQVEWRPSATGGRCSDSRPAVACVPVRRLRCPSPG